MDPPALTASRLCCCTPLLYSADACTCDSSCACTGGCIPSVPVGITAQTDLVTLLSLGVFAIVPVVQPESALQRFRHGGILRPGQLSEQNATPARRDRLIAKVAPRSGVASP
jgi:hypothetical protein